MFLSLNCFLYTYIYKTRAKTIQWDYEGLLGMKG
ncbi:MAG: hypothetical protein ACI9QD_000528 [Thermoproteota archaeon]